MRLFIAEKPSLARAIADVLPAPQRRSRTHIECGSRDVVETTACEDLPAVKRASA